MGQFWSELLPLVVRGCYSARRQLDDRTDAGAGDGRRVAGRATDRVQQQARQQGSRHGGIDFCR